MKGLQKEFESWAEKAPAVQEIADNYAKAITRVQERPNAKNIAVVEWITATLVVRVMYENGYVPVFEDDQLIGYAPKDLNDMN